MATYHVSRMQQAALTALPWVSMAVRAQENPCQPHLTGLPMPRSIYLSKDPKDDVSQINVYPNPDAPEAVRKELEEKRNEVRSLKAANRRQREEEASVDHALAALLANNELKMTPFKEDHSWLLREVANTKTAVVFKITNKDPVKPWKLHHPTIAALVPAQRVGHGNHPQAPDAQPPGHHSHGAGGIWSCAFCPLSKQEGPACPGDGGAPPF